MIAVRPLVWIVVAALVAILLLYGAYRLFGDGPRRDAAVAQAQSALTAADNQSAHQAIQTIQDNADAEAAARQITRSNHVTIIQAPGAQDPVSAAVDTAGRRAVCLRKSAAGLPECAGVRDAHP
jgi:ABC-type uncharacterized transport system substrate-binding protein